MKNARSIMPPRAGAISVEKLDRVKFCFGDFEIARTL